MLRRIVFGLLFITLASTGNSVYCKEWKKPMTGAVIVFLPVLVLYFLRGEEAGPFLAISALVLAALTAGYHLCHAAYLGWPWFRNMADEKHTLLASSVYDEMKLKTSAAKKLYTLTENALKIFEAAEISSQGSDKYYGKILQSFAKNGSRTQQAGGLVWAWKRIIGLNSEFMDQGIWISARLIASNVAQYVVALYVIVGGSRLLEYTSENYVKGLASSGVREFVLRSFDSAADVNLSSTAILNVTSVLQSFLSLQISRSGIDFGCEDFTSTAQQILSQYCVSDGTESTFDLVCDESASINYLCPLLQDDLSAREQIALLSGSGIAPEEVTQSILSIIDETAVHTVDSLYPSNALVILVPLSIAIVFAFITTAYLAVAYLPSVTCTILKLRRGIIPTLHNDRFFKLRDTPDLVAILTGSLFWGAVGSGIVVGGTIFLVVFFFMWHGTAYYAQRLVAVLLGLGGITLIRILGLRYFRKKYFRYFYREQPDSANLLLLGLEWVR